MPDQYQDCVWRNWRRASACRRSPGPITLILSRLKPSACATCRRYARETERLIGAKELALMRPTALLINTARGPFVDQQALYEALREGTFAGAGLDVFTQEPIDPHDPLLTLPNIVLSPHTAGTTPEALMNGLNLCAANVGAFLQGRVQNCVI